MLYTLSGPTTWSLVEGGTGIAIKETLRMQTMADIESGEKTSEDTGRGSLKAIKGRNRRGKTFLEAKSISARGVDSRGLRVNNVAPSGEQALIKLYNSRGHNISYLLICSQFCFCFVADIDWLSGCGGALVVYLYRSLG